MRRRAGANGMMWDPQTGGETVLVQRNLTRVAVAVARTFQTVIALVVLTHAGANLGAGTQALPRVSPLAINAVDGMFVPTMPSAASWTPLIATTLAALALRTPVLDRAHRRYRLGLLLGAGYWAAVTVLYAALFADMQAGGFTPADRGCIYDNCWPSGIQQALLAAPLLPTVVAMVLMGTVFATRHWLVRMLVPPAVFATATLAQALVWEPWRAIQNDIR